MSAQRRSRFISSYSLFTTERRGRVCAANVLPGGGCDSFSLPGGEPCALQFTSTVGQLSTEWLLTARVDQNIGNNDRLFAHFRTDHGFQATVTDAISPLFNLGSHQPQNEGQLEETHSIGANAVNQFIVSGQYYSSLFRSTRCRYCITNLRADHQPGSLPHQHLRFVPRSRFISTVGTAARDVHVLEEAGSVGGPKSRDRRGWEDWLVTFGRQFASIG